MNGARADPCAKTSTAPTTSIMRMTGASHHFFRSRRYAQSSPVIPLAMLRSIFIEPWSKLPFHAAGAPPPLGPLLPEACVGCLVDERVPPERPPRDADRCQHQEIHRR